MRHARRTLALALCMGVATIAAAQSGLAADDPDWKESEVPPPPAFDQSRLVDIEMPVFMSLKIGIDPATVAIGGDGIVRYVVVARNKSGGGLNAFYDGMRCATNESKTYARYGADAWQPIANPEWKKVGDAPSNYTKRLARQGVCRDSAPRSSVADIVDHIKQPVRNLE
ncbi:CNP1-like family protein [Variovorax sp. PAMC 28711]|uniref:CNP1-like family protein n=1 Tax=Variovorax sp. PAMC 28711 TaxID=1795631 RepID=UPI001F2BE251|nr:CNP1-like family protein [Variovorax sp. PAMC 28711]